MTDEQSQKELFPFETDRRAFPRLGKIFSGPSSEQKFAVVITLERLVIIAIGIILAMVIVYAVGVETGRVSRPAPRLCVPVKAPGVNSEEPKAIHTTVSPIKTVPVQFNTVVTPSRQSGSVKPEASFGAVQISSQTVTGSAAGTAGKTAGPEQPLYTIVAATFLKKETAVAEAARAKKIGLEPRLTQDGQYIVMTVGAYPAKETALSALAKLRAIYKDARVRGR